MNTILKEDIINVCEDKNIRWKEFDNKSFLITGATGLIGSLLIKTLIYVAEKKKLNLQLYAQIRDSKKARRIFNDVLINELNFAKVSFIVSDIRELKCKRKVDYIIHGANSTSSQDFVIDPVGTIDVLINGTKSVLELAVKNKVQKMIYLSYFSRLQQ